MEMENSVKQTLTQSLQPTLRLGLLAMISVFQDLKLLKVELSRVAEGDRLFSQWSMVRSLAFF